MLSTQHYKNSNDNNKGYIKINFMYYVVKGLALTIGLNFVDPSHYAGWDGQLSACEFDAEDMTDVAKSRGFEVQKLLTKAATSENV
ncbi:MAG TPA: hypothetical protein VFC05_13805, partial [Nitrososphaeraceae archaeon]|nr:hypothetical protein [Nitrososphaeraceae archaeon]